jgi:hypothetical protein
VAGDKVDLHIVARIDDTARSYARSVDEEHSIADVHSRRSDDTKYIEDIREIWGIQIGIPYRRDRAEEY